MGNSSSSSKKKYSVLASNFGGAYIKLDKDSFFPGDTLSGTAYFNLVNIYPGNKLYLSFKGYEFASWLEAVETSSTDSEGNSTSSTTYYRREEKFNIFKQEREMYNWGQGNAIPTGQYAFPFQFIIPQNLPGSFFITAEGGTLTAEIRYTLTAYMMPHQNATQKLKYKAPITVREFPRTAIQPKQVTMTKNVTTCCCCDQGSITIKIASEKDAYAPSEEVKLVAEIDNSRCGVAVENIRFNLMQKVFLRAGSHTYNKRIPVYHLDLGRIAPGDTCLGDKAKKIVIRLPRAQEGNAKEVAQVKAKTKGKTDQGYDPKAGITPSTHGRLISSDFYLQIHCKVDGCMCCGGKHPNTELPIFVYAPILVKMPDPAPPMNWQPQQIAPVNVAWNVDMSAYGQGAYNNQNYSPNTMQNQAPYQNPGQTYAPNGNQAPIQSQQYYQNPNQPQQAVMINNNMNSYNQATRI